MRYYIPYILALIALTFITFTGVFSYGQYMQSYHRRSETCQKACTEIHKSPGVYDNRDGCYCMMGMGQIK